MAFHSSCGTRLPPRGLYEDGPAAGSPSWHKPARPTMHWRVCTKGYTLDNERLHELTGERRRKHCLVRQQLTNTLSVPFGELPEHIPRIPTPQLQVDLNKAVRELEHPVHGTAPVSYTHLTLPTKRIV
eukprot:TRINITY_DN18302_c0_g1_i2.p1 TRINITY_DN18302_c0_g1~~TRINITY_DN18302_c0_g1_i2.p1  ORF type:complete len:128 (-),score=24.83 TRINITY_DN18302_c0_g1_i2:85-468(-)